MESKEEESTLSLFIVGRYNKFSRNLCQTPWVIDGVKRMESSVQEIICSEIETRIDCEKFKFSAAGREDVDVQMLGDGRPFVVELIKPKVNEINDQLLEDIESAINANHAEVKVRNLQLAEKKEVRMQLRNGETDKTKGYRALCCINRPITDADLKKLNSISELTISQKTPIRVLHRRSLLDRTRIIHKLSAVRTQDDKKFEIELTTEAGTYIKEFVHGDFGRTSPNLAEIIGDCHTDIMELDVTGITMDWPKPKTCQKDPNESKLLTSSSSLSDNHNNSKRIKLLNSIVCEKEDESGRDSNTSPDSFLPKQVDQIKT